MSAGRLRSSRLSGNSSTAVMIANTRQAQRQPSRAIMICSHGSRMIEPRPTPENAMPSASPRRRTNQFGMNCDCTL